MTTPAPAPATADTRCRAHTTRGPCRCGGYYFTTTVGAYHQCSCGHTEDLHRPPKPRKKETR